jgi:trimethylamine---corrinoid protein Co-methyltransferase
MDFNAAFAEQFGFDQAGIAQMHQGALRTLRELGISVENQAARAALSAAGVRIDGTRAYFEPRFVEDHLQALRRNWGMEPVARPLDRLTVSVGDMCQYYHNPHNDEIELMSTANVIEATRSVAVLRDRGLGSYVPGVPRDVPPQLQAILEYRIGAEFAPGGPTLDTLHPPEALEYLFAMSDALGRPMRGTNIFSVSPLRLSGYEFDLAVEFRERWDEYSVTTYPAVTISAPLHSRAAWVLSIAEALGGAVTLHVVSGGKPVSITPGMFPFDLRTLTMIGGMPECAWMYWARAQVCRFYEPSAGYSMMLGTQAKRPDLQAGYEKAIAGTLGVLTGCDDLHYIGVLSFDDIFSPEGMLVDLELRDALLQLRRGIPNDDPEQWVDVIREGLEKGYMQAETTLNHYPQSFWFSRLFDRLSWHSFQESRAKTARQRARDEILSRLASYNYHPPQVEIGEVRRIFNEAWRKLGGDPHAEYLPLLYNDRLKK